LEDIEVLAKEKAEEAVKAEKVGRSLAGSPFVSIYESIDIVDRFYTSL